MAALNFKLVLAVLRGKWLFSDKLWRRLRQKFRQKERKTAVILPRHDHPISRSQISSNALKVLYRLKKAGYAGYLVGGGVRDILVGLTPKDFDIATDATPDQVHKLFRNSRVIGRRFRIVHVFFTDEIIEVSTFRANAEEQQVSDERLSVEAMPAMIANDNTYGTIEEDAWRRDFTVNALYYNIEDFAVVDYTGGMLDLEQRQIRMIGDPSQRYHEDPVRLLRAIRLAAKLDFSIEAETERPINELAHLLSHLPPSRLFEEILKLFFKGYAVLTYQRLQRYGYLEVLFTYTARALAQPDTDLYHRLIELACAATDERVATDKSVNPGFLFAILLWPALQQRLSQQQAKQCKLYQAMHQALEQVIADQLETIKIPKRFTTMIRAIWLLQYHLISRRGKRVWRTFNHRYFRAAYDFLALRAEIGEPYQEAVDWWTCFQKAKRSGRQRMIKDLSC